MKTNVPISVKLIYSVCCLLSLFCGETSRFHDNIDAVFVVSRMLLIDHGRVQSSGHLDETILIVFLSIEATESPNIFIEIEWCKE
jgi:hypothetical protein